ncbi:iron chelate uptake ABC transporter family permease subunit [Bartonella apihabitans]|uniref:iron chelate uptake ABC transporter family permease subunit n=1 Tax=Bartonella apihabitans TaxID=2750929 RepID=UPI0016624A68|nr:iron chelate uptake ABC transporter family permease subunit [Bartonella apihabitans]
MDWYLGAHIDFYVVEAANPHSPWQRESFFNGVGTVAVSRFALACAIVASCSAVAVCGPISFIGLIVPHMIKPLVGQDFKVTLPASALTGATLCLLASTISQNAFQPYVVNTGIILDLFGGIVFILLIRKFYVSPKTGTTYEDIAHT